MSENTSINLVARNLLNFRLSARNIPFAGNSTLGKGAVVHLYQCVTWTVDKICILYTSKALKWGKVLMQIFADPRGTWFLARKF